MNFKLKIWRQADAKAKGGFETYEVNDISEDTSFLEMLDILNNNLIHEGKEPWRSAAFPVIKDLVVERSAFDKIMQAGGFISVNTGGVPDANTIPVPRDDAEESMDAAACIGCGACVATCKNGSAMLFVAARVSSLAKLPQGKVETLRRAKAMIAKMDELGFGGCTNTRACEAECPKSISISHIARLNRKFLTAKFKD